MGSGRSDDPTVDSNISSVCLTCILSLSGYSSLSSPISCLGWPPRILLPFFAVTEVVPPNEPPIVIISGAVNFEALLLGVGLLPEIMANRVDILARSGRRVGKQALIMPQAPSITLHVAVAFVVSIPSVKMVKLRSWWTDIVSSKTRKQTYRSRQSHQTLAGL